MSRLISRYRPEGHKPQPAPHPWKKPTRTDRLLTALRNKYPEARITAIGASSFRLNFYAAWDGTWVSTKRVVDSYIVHYADGLFVRPVERSRPRGIRPW